MYVGPPAAKSLLSTAYGGLMASESKENNESPKNSGRLSQASKPINTKASSSSSSLKQRGIYSEYLGQSTPAAEREVSNGPTAGQLISPHTTHPHAIQTAAASHIPIPPLAQKPPKVSTFKRTAATNNDVRTNHPSLSSTTSLHSPPRVSSRLEPKVLVPFDQRPGKPPRRIEIERKKRLYASQDIEKLLKSLGVDYASHGVNIDHATGQPSYLPLEVFDNTDYECRAAKEWIELGKDEESGLIHIPAKALRFEGRDGTAPGHYIPCVILGYDENDQKFILRYADNGEHGKLHRIHIYLEAESPFDYVRRVVFAHKLRRHLEAAIRYSLYVDNMPTDEIQPLDTEQVNRILLLALNTKKLKQNALDTTALLNEVNIDYGRTMNKIIFDVNLNDPANASLRQQLFSLMEEEMHDPTFSSFSPLASANNNNMTVKPVPYLGVVKTAYHDFPKHFSNFCFHSFYTKLEAITALVKVNSECLRLQKLQIFHTALTKSVRLEEFEQLQSTSMTQLAQFLKDKWIAALKNCIKNSLREVGKGWLNLQEKNREVYQFSKLKKFMKMVGFMMEDALRFLIEDSLHKYDRFLAMASKYRVAVSDTNEVKVDVLENYAEEDSNKSSSDENDEKSSEDKDLPSNPLGTGVNPADGNAQARARDFALFSVDLVIKDGQIQYTTSPNLLHQTPLNLLDKALGMLHDIPQLETHVMEHLFWYGHEARLVSVHREEKHVQKLYDAMSERLQHALQPMTDYLAKFQRYEEFLHLNVDNYINEFASLDNDLHDIKKEISLQLQEKERVEEEVPKSVWLGIVTVNCEDVRRKLVAKRNEILQKELDYLAKLTKNRCEEVGKNFKKIEGELKKTPADIQELTKIKEYMATVPITVQSYREPISEALDSFEVLESFSYRLPKDLFKLKWQTYGWPKAIHDSMEYTEVRLANEKQVFLHEMRTAQDEFMAELLDVEKKVNSFGQYSDVEKTSKIAEKCSKIQEQLDDLQTRARNFNSNENLFNLPTTDYRHVTKVVKNFEPYYQLWTTAAEWMKNHQSWMNDSFLDLDGDKLATDVTNYNKTIAKCLKAKAIKENPGCLTIASNVKKELDAFKPFLPLVIALRNPGMRDRHWDMLSNQLPFPFVPDESTTLTRVLEDYKLQNYLEVITKVGESAGKEYQIESALIKMEEGWKGKDFTIVEYKKTGTFVVRDVDEIIAQLDADILTTQSLQFSPFKKVFEDRINRWANKLNLVSEVVEEWLAVQRQWISLQAIFSSGDINKQLPAEAKRFASVNKTWRLIMSQVSTNPDALAFADNPSLLQKLQDANKMLSTVQKRLTDYLDKKRAVFARFYFLANEELLQILSQSTDPLLVQPFLKKCFENIQSLYFDADQVIHAMFSSEQERVEFVKKIDPKKKNVEHWLGEVEQVMKDTVRCVMADAITDYVTRPRKEWVKKWPGQCVLNGSQVHWTMEVEKALREEGLPGVEKYAQALSAQLGDMVELVRSNLTDLQQLTMGALIVLDVHARDVVDKLVKEKCSSPNDFAWIMNMRYYQEEKDNSLTVQMVQSRFPYSNEYLGNSLRLVITPLTDRCYMTLMSALQLHLGGAPAGPAGTGKTETVKDLAKAVAKQCVVFNCSDGLDYLAMGKFFKGLAASGAWACFDEFNRIDIEVLSVVAQQIQTIWEAVREGVRTFVFEETEIKLDPTCSVFITMNPGYAGRTELPDNLQALFRPVAMMVPDYALIGEIMLYSFGFNNARALSRKMTSLLRLCSEQLSAQDHYDYGMRAVKTIITRAGQLKRESPNANEDVLVLRALSDVNRPKFLAHDLPLFYGIMSDLFPGVKPPEIDYGVLMNSLILTCKETGLQPAAPFLEKCIQLYETIVVRHGVMLVGPTGGAKTTNIRTLQAAMTRLKNVPPFARVKTQTLNPKAIHINTLYGFSDINTKEWTDGILASIVRECIDDTSNARKWVVFDGPVDAVWIENMNTVLDDNKKLCLVSGEILQLTPTMTMVFEVEDLAVASPATVSRCGMVFMEPSALGTAALVKSWLDNLHRVFTETKKPLQLYFDLLLDSSIQFIRKHCVEPVPTVDNNLARGVMNILDCFFAPYVPIEGVSRTEEQENGLANVIAHIEPIFILALIWAVGASTDKNGRFKFNGYLRQMLDECGLKEVPPAKGLIYDWLYDPQQQQWISWSDSQPAYKFDDRLSYAELIIPTQDSIRYTYFLDLLVNNRKHVLFTGSTGTGKTINVFQYLAKLPNDLTPINVTFSAATTASQTEDLLMGKMQKRRQRVFGPPLGKRFVIFVDDMNMPQREKYFAQPPIELLRQWMDHGGWYDRKALHFVEIVDVSFIGAMGPPGGGRNPVTNRFIRHFNQIAHTDLEDESLKHIFLTIVENTLLKFTQDIQDLSENVVKATISVYNSVSNGLLPTPSKSHYTFNLRDLSAVFQGMLSASFRRITTVPGFLRLWIHENRRVYRDRLVADDDRQWMDNLLAGTLQDNFNIAHEEVLPLDANGQLPVLLFGDYMDGMGSEQKMYDEVKDIRKAVKIMEDCLNEYNDENTPMKLVLFVDAIEHVSRICRVLRQPGGNALLLGVGGSGRQSLSKLATYMSEYELFQVEITKNYGVVEWYNDLRKLLLDAGLKEQPTVFLLSDTQIVSETFFNDINNILNSGDVPNLFSNEDMDNIFATCKVDCQRKNIPATKINAYTQFITRVRASLHVVLCMSPMGEKFRTRLRMFPALVNCCTIDYFESWSQTALSAVATSSLTEEDLKLDNLSATVDAMKVIHENVIQQSVAYREELRRYNYVTPTSFLELINVFKFLLQEKRNEVGGLRSKLQYGLDTLATASEDVARLQIDLREKQPRLIETQKEVELTIEQIAVDKKDAAATKEIVEKQEADAALKANECKMIRDDAQSELDKALPELDRALESLRHLNKNDIDEVRNFKKPPAAVILTMEAAVVMLRQVLKLKIVMKADASGIAKIPDYWQTAQKYLLKQPKLLLETLKKYDRDNIPEDVITKIKPYISSPDFSVKRVETASVACRAICQWVHAMYAYYWVNKSVEPKRITLKGAEEELDKVMVTLNEAREKMRQVEERVQALSDKYEALVAESDSLKAGVEMCQVKLERANKLIGGLGGEKDRWSATVARLDIAYDCIVGDVLISAGTIAYLGAFTAAYRQNMTTEWRNNLVQLTIKHTENCDIRSTLGDPVQIRAWNIAGLPADNLSTENGIIMSKARRWPFMIDPQGQAGKFIKRLGSQKFEEGMEICTLTQKNYVQTFENAVRFGRWVLLEGVQESLPAELEPLLLQQIISVKGVPTIKIGDVGVPYNDGFHLYIVTKLPNPHLSPELQVKISLLNFTITPDGLQDQMLGTVVAKESPELEQKKNALVVQNARMKKQMQDTEDQILRLLSEAKGDILDDESLIDTLAASKKTSEEINERVAEAEIVEKDIDIARRAYTGVAERASILYFCIADLALIDPMYQYSLTWFVQLCVNGIGQAPASTDLNQRLQNLIDYFTKSLYENVCRSLFESHKLLFSFLLTVKIMQAKNLIQGHEWRWLVTGAPPTKLLANPAPEWLTEQVWSDVLALSDLPTFSNFEVDFVQHLPHFQRIFDSPEPQNEPLPEPWQTSLDDFQKMMVLKTIRADKMSAAITTFVSTNLGKDFTEPPQFNLANSYKDAVPTTPLIFILSKGADPASKLFAFANDMGFRDKITSISLGQGQGVIAQKNIEDAIKKGGWVLLQNCHLALSWLPTLERIILEIKPEEVHDDFRLWLTSEPTPGFPVSILQNGIKMTNEPPKGLKANLMRSYLGFTDNMMNKCKRPTPFKKLLFSMCFFHAVLLERKKYGSLGWNIAYAFSENDLGVCITQLRDFLDMYEDIPFQTIHFLTYDINYGGRVTDDVDRRTVRTILNDFVNPRVLNDDYSFSPSGKYLSIPTGTREHYLKYINSMDAVTHPEVFGMHENADITSAQEETNSLFSTILALLPRSSAGAGKSREQQIDETAVTILDRTPIAWELENVMKKYPTSYNESMNTVLVQEVIRYNRLLNTMKNTLEQLRKALKGEMVMTESLEAMASSLFNNTVPELWNAVSYPSLMSLAAWVNDLIARVQFINNWVEHGIPIVFWISGFFFPQAFLTGTLQNFARKYAKPIDGISFSFHVLDKKPEQIMERPSDGLYIHGLFLEGARWDASKNSLVDSRPKELFTSFPVLWLLPEEERKEPETGIYRCPVYKTLTRRGVLSTTGHSTNFVMWVEIPTTVPQAKWIKGGVALFQATSFYIPPAFLNAKN